MYTKLYYGGFMRFKDLTGKRFGKLIAIERIPKQIGRTVKWKCLCDCGNESVVTRANLDSGSTTSCGQHRFFNLENKEFGRLKVIRRGNDYHHKSGTLISWICKCKCGNTKDILAYQLTSGKTRSCGCLRKQINKIKFFKGYNDISGKHWSSVRGAAKRRCLQFDITIKDVWNLYIKQNKLCAISGISVQFNLDNKLTTASIDRIDNTKGYTLDNIQILHKTINIMKNNLEQNYFIEICNKISKNMENKCINTKKYGMQH